LNHQPTLLIVDDNVTNAEVLYEVLSLDYDVLVALDGPYALEIAKEEHPDLILLDVMMPQMDGYEVCRRLKSDPATADIPVLFVTACQDQESIQKMNATEAFGFIPKPILFDTLYQKIDQALQLSHNKGSDA
jgi:putative two-component system response regulator